MKRAFILVQLLIGTSAGGVLPMLGVSGESIVNANGEEVILRGMNMDLYYGRVDDNPAAALEYADEGDIQYLAELGCNSLRLCLHWKLFEGETGFDLIDTYLSWCEPRGIYLILDMHRVPPDDSGESLCALWASIAERYRDTPAIAGFDIQNEPPHSDPESWWNLAERVAGSIREAGSNHIIFVETPGGQCRGLRLIEDPNTVYSIHCYEPFTVSHAGADWPGDSPVPENSAYPGMVLTGVQWVGWSSSVPKLTTRAEGQVEWDSGSIVIPEGVELVSMKAYASGNTGTVRFYGLSLSLNGEGLRLINGDIETPSRRRPGEPASWYFYTDGNFSGSWRNGALYSHGSRGTASWIQTRSFFTEPLFQVQAGDTLDVSGRILAPRNRGEVALGLDYLVERREYWNIDSLRASIHQAVDWAVANEVPLYVGEFGSLPGPDRTSRNNLIGDWVTVLNEAGVHWSFWTFRNPGSQAYGLFYDHSSLDEAIAEILARGFAGG